MRKKCLNWLQTKHTIPALLGILGILLGVLFVYHDIQVKQGAGLYLAMQAKSENRLVFDLLLDGVRVLTIFLSVWIPCLVFRKKGTVSLFSCLALYISFMPITNMGELVHYFDRTGVTLTTYLPSLHWALSFGVVLCLFLGIRAVFEKHPELLIWEKGLHLFLLLRIIFRLHYIYMLYHR